MMCIPHWSKLARCSCTVDLAEGYVGQDWTDLRIMMHQQGGSNSSVSVEDPRRAQVRMV